MKPTVRKPDVRKWKTLSANVLCLISTWMIGIGGVSASTFFVATGGDDSNPGTESRPWRSVQKAADALGAGDTVLIQSGSYDGTVRPARSGAPDAYIVFRAQPGHSPVLTSPDSITFHINGRSYIEINGLTITGTHKDGTGIQPDAGAHHIRILNNRILGNGESGIGTGSGADYIHIEGNEIFGNSFTSLYQGSGVSLWQLGKYDNSPEPHNIIRRNRIHGNRNDAGVHSDGNGIIVDASGDNPPVLIENNLIFNNGGRCVNVYKSGNTTIVNNTCFMNNSDQNITDGEIWAGGSANVKAFNNLIYSRSGRPTTSSYDSSGLVFDYNLHFNGPARIQGAHDIVADPKLLVPNPDPTMADFRLKADSPAIDRGASESAPTIDFEGNSRPIGNGSDIGAYEYRGNARIMRPNPPRNLMLLP